MPVAAAEVEPVVAVADTAFQRAESDCIPVAAERTAVAAEVGVRNPVAAVALRRVALRQAVVLGLQLARRSAG